MDAKEVGEIHPPALIQIKTSGFFLSYISFSFSGHQASRRLTERAVPCAAALYNQGVVAIPEGGPAPPVLGSIYAESEKRAAPHPVSLSAVAASGVCLLPRPSLRGNPSPPQTRLLPRGPLEAAAPEGAAHLRRTALAHSKAPALSADKGTKTDPSLHQGGNDGTEKRRGF